MTLKKRYFGYYNKSDRFSGETETAKIPSKRHMEVVTCVIKMQVYTISMLVLMNM